MSIGASDFRPIRTGEPNALLAGIWRRVMRDYDLDLPRLDDLITEHARKLTFMTPEKQMQYRGNVLSDLVAESMTWGTFLRGIRGIGCKEMTLTLKLHHLKYATSHRLILEFPKYDVDPEATPAGMKKKPPTELHGLYMAIMRDLGLSIDDINNFLTRYMVRTRIPLTPQDKSSVRGNVKKELFQERLSWNSFIRGLNFLEITKVEVHLDLKFKNHTSKHKQTIIINDPLDLLEELKSLAATETTNEHSSSEPAVDPDCREPSRPDQCDLDRHDSTQSLQRGSEESPQVPTDPGA